jgi:hypothetical protein
LALEVLRVSPEPVGDVLDRGFVELNLPIDDAFLPGVAHGFLVGTPALQNGQSLACSAVFR